MSLAPHEKRLIELAFFYGQDATQSQIQVWANFLAPKLSIDELARAIEMYCNDSTNEWFPKPVTKLVDLIHPKTSADSEAKLIAGRVVEAVSKFGHPSPGQAREFIGPVGWSAVKAYGEWSYICENLGVNISMGQFQAQIRDHAKAQIESGASHYNENQLEHRGNEKLGSLVKHLSEQKEMER